jgi:nucleoside-diphosphate-sugar epimerase
VTREQHLRALRGRRVLVTGATGFIGGRLIRRFEEAGVGYTAVHHGSPAPMDSRGRWLKLDLADAAETGSMVAGARPDVVFHLAGVRGAERSLAFAEHAFRENLLASHHLLVELGRRARAHRIVIMGSSEEYGRQEKLPCTEDLPDAPVSPYSASKAAVTRFALLYHELFDMPVVVLRPFVVYGPGQGSGMLIPSLLEALGRGERFRMTPGEQTRDFIYVDDVVDAMIAASVADGAVGEIFNVCSGQERRIRDVAEVAARVAGTDGGSLDIGALQYRQNEVWRLVGSNEKARRILAWSPRVELEEGLRHCLTRYSE